MGRALVALLGFHCDGFNPLRSRPNDFSLTYGILRSFVGPEVPSNIAGLTITGYVMAVEFIAGGPQAVVPDSRARSLKVDLVVRRHPRRTGSARVPRRLRDNVESPHVPHWR